MAKKYDNEKLDPSHEPAMSHAAQIARDILRSSRGYADGGMLEAQSGEGDEMEEISDSGDEFMSYEPEEKLDGVTNLNKRLSGIFSKMRKL